MGWASRYIQKLRAGETVSFRPHGQSMTGHIESGQLATIGDSSTGGLDRRTFTASARRLSHELRDGGHRG